MQSWGIVTDEVMAEPIAAIRAIAGWGLGTIELRGVGAGRRIPDIEPDEVRRLQQAVKAAGLTISALSPGTWKCSLHEAAAEQQADRFRRTLDLAERLSVARIITFSVRRDPKDDASAYERVRDLLGSMSREARRRGLVLCIENERGWWADTEAAIVRLLQDLDPDGLRLNWDAGNYADAGGRDGAAAWTRLQNWVENVHLKDVCILGTSRQWCLLGQGQVGWSRLLPLMLASGRPVPMSIETHCPPLLENSRLNREWLRSFEAIPGQAYGNGQST